MTNLGTISVNSGKILKLWFEVDQFRESVGITPDTSESYSEDDKVGVRSYTATTGEQITLSPTVSYSPSGNPISFTYSSDNPSDIDISPEGNIAFMVEPEETSSANITVTATSGLETATRVYNVTLTLSGASVVETITGGVIGSARKEFSDSLDNALLGADPSTQKLIYTTQDHAASTYVRNTSFFLQSTHAEALTCVSPWNSRQANNRSGTAITPRHVVLAEHYPLHQGDSIRFVTSNNTVITRTVVKASNISYNGVGTDARIVLLDSDLPSSIKPCNIFPDNFETYLPAGVSSNTMQSLPLLCTDQQEKGLILDFIKENDSESTPSLQWGSPSIANRLAFYEPIIVGDSGNPIFVVTDSELWLLSTFHGGTGGPFYGGLVSELNEKIIELDTLQGDITGYTVTEGDLSSFNTY